MRSGAEVARAPLPAVAWGSSLDQLRRARPRVTSPLPALAFERFRGPQGLRRIWYSFMPEKGLYKVKLDFEASLESLAKLLRAKWGAPKSTVATKGQRERLRWRFGSSAIEAELSPHLLKQKTVRLLIRDTRVTP